MLLQSILCTATNGAVYPDESFNLVFSVNETSAEGEFIIGGYNWIKRLVIRLK